MSDRDKTKQQLIDELNEMRKQIAEFEEAGEEHKRFLAELHENEAIWNTIANTTPDFVAVVDREMIIRTMNQSMAQRFGKHPEELIGTCDLDLVPPELAKSRKQYFDKVLQTGQTCRWEDENQGMYFDNIVFPVKEDKGKVTRVAIIARDITERKQAEKELREAAFKHRIVADNTYDWEWWLSPVGMFAYVSPSCSRITGYNASEFMDNAELFRTIIHLDDLSIWDNHRCETSQGEVSSAIEFRILHKDGSERWIEHICQQVFDDTGKFQGSRGSNRDITDRKQVEESLKASEENFRSSLDNSPLGVRIVTSEGDTLYANKAILDMYGYRNLKEFRNTSSRQRYTPESYAEHVERREKRKAGEYVPASYEISIIRKDGEIRVLEVLRETVRWTGKEEFHVIYQDVTERRKMEEGLRESEERYRNIVETSPDGIVTLNVYGIVTACNKSFVNLIGYPMDEILGKHIAELPVVRPSDIPVVTELFASLLTDDIPGTVEWQWTRKDGTQRIGEFRMAITEEAGVTSGFQVVVRDVTERRLMEEERRRIERLESIGTLAGGIAHDFNNLLTGILGNISLARGYVQPDSKTAERLLEAERASLRARDLTQQLLTFARGGEPVKETMAIGKLIRDAATFALGGSRSTCVADIPENLWQVYADKGQINEVVNNLVINAEEAMPGGGIINISARNRVIREGGLLSLPGGDYIELSIEDHGVGIPEDNLARIYEPYFTTKETGSGLGLATTYSIIKNHEGNITVDSTPGVGTTFRVYLPATRRSSISLEEEAEDTQPPHTGKILIMDDEEVIRRMLQRALSEVGHDITLAKDGPEAIEQYVRAREQGQPFDLVILDLTVPGSMGGKEVIEKLLAIDPDVRSIVSSGYSTDPIMADYRKYGFDAVIAKPYRIRELRGIIRDILKEE